MSKLSVWLKAGGREKVREALLGGFAKKQKPIEVVQEIVAQELLTPERKALIETCRARFGILELIINRADGHFETGDVDGLIDDYQAFRGAIAALKADLETLIGTLIR